MIDERALTVGSEMANDPIPTHEKHEGKGVSQLVMPSTRITDSESSYRQRREIRVGFDRPAWVWARLGGPEVMAGWVGKRKDFHKRALAG
jgi:hypothetical protein